MLTTIPAEPTTVPTLADVIEAVDRVAVLLRHISDQITEHTEAS